MPEPPRRRGPFRQGPAHPKGPAKPRQVIWEIQEAIPAEILSKMHIIPATPRSEEATRVHEKHRSEVMSSIITGLTKPRFELNLSRRRERAKLREQLKQHLGHLGISEKEFNEGLLKLALLKQNNGLEVYATSEYLAFHENNLKLALNNALRKGEKHLQEVASDIDFINANVLRPLTHMLPMLIEARKKW